MFRRDYNNDDNAAVNGNGDSGGAGTGRAGTGESGTGKKVNG